MKQGYIILMVFFLSGLFEITSSQELFQKRYGGTGEERYPKIVLTEDNGHLIYYRTTTNSFGDYDMALMKIDSAGKIEWNKHFGTIKRDLTKQIIPYGNNFLLAGWMNQEGYVDDIHLITMDENGNIISQKTWGESYDDEIYSVTYLNSGDFALVGSTLSYTINGNAELVYSTFDANLNMNTVFVFSTSVKDIGRKIIQGNNSSIYIAGNLVSGNNSKGFLMKLNLQGNLLWAKKIGFNNSSKFWDVIQVEGDDLLCAGFEESTTGTGNNILLARFENTGNLLWAKTMSLGEDGNSSAIQLIKSFEGNYIVAGTTTNPESGGNDLFFITIDANGNFISGYTYGGDLLEDWPSLDYRTQDSGFTIVAETQSFDAVDFDLYFINTDNSGKSCCSKPITDIVVQNIDLNLQPVNFSTATTVFYQQYYNIQKNELDDNEEVLCYSPVNIIGPDTLYCNESENAKYTTDIDFLLDLSWVIPESATLLNNVNDTTVYIDFNDQSGMIYLLSGTCTDTLDSLYVFVEGTNNINLGNDTLVCSGQSFYLYAGSGFDTYLWQDGSTDSIYLVDTSGIYWVQVSNSCGIASDTIRVTFGESFDIDLGPDTSFCYGQKLLLSPGGGFYAYYWQDGSTDSVLFAGNTGYYWVQVTDSAGCTATDSIYIDAYMEFSFSLGPDTVAICEGDYIILKGPEGYPQYEWQDGSDYPDFIADTAGIYWLEVTAENGCAARDSMLLMVNIIPDDFLGNDTVMCQEENFVIHAPPYYEKYLWQDGSTDSVFVAREPGDYSVYVEDSIGCSGADTITLSLFEPPQLSRNGDTTMCPGDALVLSPGNGLLYYKWNTGSTDSAIQVIEAGEYWVETGTNCGIFTDSILVEFYSNPDFSLGPDTNICGDEKIVLSAGPGFLSYLWSDGTTDSVLIVYEPGTYSVVIDDGRCRLSDTVKVDECNLLWIPNVFTPNNDGYNDYFYAVGENVTKFQMVIFNRWGVKMATLNSIEEKWDGRYKGVLCADGVYYYEAVYEEIGRDLYPVRRQVHGSVTLISEK